MIRQLTQIKNESPKFIKEFFENCTITEKIDAHYCFVRICSKHNFKFFKNDKKELTQVDMIINSIWEPMMKMLTELLIKNFEWTERNIGTEIFFFYFPNKCPLRTTYKNDYSFVFDRIEYPSNIKPETYDEYKERFNDFLSLSTKKLVHGTTTYNTRYGIHPSWWLEENEYDINPDMSVKDMYDIFSKCNIGLLSDDPEGFILRDGKHTYQICKHNPSEPISFSQKTYLEYILMDILKYYKKNKDDFDKFITPHNYVKTICNIFESYYIDRVNFIHMNFYPEDLTPYHIGPKLPETNYNLIPSSKTTCMIRDTENDPDGMAELVFKLMLVNLKKKLKCKDNVRGGHPIATEIFIEDWNKFIDYLLKVTA